MIQYFEDGGFFVFVILGFSIWASTLILERFLFYRKLSKSLKNISKTIVTSKTQSVPQLIQNIENLKLFWGKEKMIQTFFDIQKKDLSKIEIENSIKELSFSYLHQIDKGLMSISTLAGLQPLLGLLGTITGMMITFAAISEAGTGDPKILAKGISQAMITTQAGLFSAIPLIILHRFLKNRCKEISEKLRILFKRILKDLTNVP